MPDANINTKINLSKQTVPYSILPNEIMRNEELSMDARGLWALMNGYHDDWEFNKKHLMKLTGWGRDKLQKAINALKEIGLLKIEPINENGKLNGYVWMVCTRTTENQAADKSGYIRKPTDKKTNNKKTLQKSEDFKLKPTKPSFDETFEKLWNEIYGLLPADKKSYASKKLTKQRILKITKRKTDPISISRIAHAVLHFYNSPSQKKDNRKFCKAPQYVIGDELFYGFLDKGPYKFGGGNDDDAFHKLWTSRAAHYAKTKRFDAQWVKGSLSNVPDKVRQYFPKEDWQNIGFIKKDLG